MMNEPTYVQIVEYANGLSMPVNDRIYAAVTHFLAKQKPETGDMLSFEEWKKSIDPKFTPLCDAWESARQGMIALPPESEWPEEVESMDFVVHYHFGKGRVETQTIKQVHRTKPQSIKMSMAELIACAEKVKGGPVEIVE